MNTPNIELINIVAENTDECFMFACQLQSGLMDDVIKFCNPIQRLNITMTCKTWFNEYSVDIKKERTDIVNFVRKMDTFSQEKNNALYSMLRYNGDIVCKILIGASIDTFVIAMLLAHVGDTTSIIAAFNSWSFRQKNKFVELLSLRDDHVLLREICAKTIYRIVAPTMCLRSSAFLNAVKDNLIGAREYAYLLSATRNKALGLTSYNEMLDAARGRLDKTTANAYIYNVCYKTTSEYYSEDYPNSGERAMLIAPIYRDEKNYVLHLPKKARDFRF